MEGVLVKFVENSPILALLAVFIYVSFKAQEKRDTQMIAEREKFLEAIQNGIALSRELSSDVLKSVGEQSGNLRRLMEIVMQTHTYQKIEHEQMIKILEKLNGRT